MFIENAARTGCNVTMPAKCDRCERVIQVPVPQQWLSKLDEYQGRFPVRSGRSHRYWSDYVGDIPLRISLQVCPGNEDGSCLAMRTLEDTKTWWELKELPGTFAADQTWLQLGLPSDVGLLAAPGWQEKLQSAVEDAFRDDPPHLRLNNSWVIYFHWRCAWHFFCLRKGGMRHENAKLQRMWGSIEADLLLWQFGMLEDADLEALYCTSIKNLMGLISCRWDYGLTILEMFFGIRRDINKDQFNPLKMAVQHADTAMRKYLSACVNKAEMERHVRRRVAFAAFRHVEQHLRRYANPQQLGLFNSLRKWPSLPLDELREVCVVEYDKGVLQQEVLQKK
ncbi:hypothetical protein CORC01_01988 [Colletotrichum orchidophilum]|uniref:Uncharacterized protein n=1 Tax=Colletotrichum orchidophilum TaxID=1209926 RepID=A0A1G4BMA5_9PEZI|nr:uncharacterized protein CORC01_01988 [Colletotrichum orchidophilum]OHF02592.1 hypothetical protein CORC01_01988 [Colletotrichum orchidophilum]